MGDTVRAAVRVGVGLGLADSVKVADGLGVADLAADGSVDGVGVAVKEVAGLAVAVAREVEEAVADAVAVGVDTALRSRPSPQPDSKASTKRSCALAGH